MEPSPYRCGPGWMPEWMREMFSTQFNSSCSFHDERYQDGKLPRKEIDRLFLRDMQIQAGDSLWWTMVAYLYYLVARIFGSSRYSGEEGV